MYFSWMPYLYIKIYFKKDAPESIIINDFHSGHK